MTDNTLPTPTSNSVPSTDIRDHVYAGAMLDKAMTGTNVTYTDRLGGVHKTWYGIEADLKSSGAAMAFSNAATLLAFVPTTANVLAMDASTGTYYYWDGSAWTQVPNSSLPWFYELLVLQNGTPFANVTTSTLFTDGAYYDADGVLHSDGVGVWKTQYIPVVAGQIVKAVIRTGSVSSGAVVPVMTQLDVNKSYVSTLNQLIATGNVIASGTYYAAAAQDGFIAVRIRTDGVDKGNVYISMRDDTVPKLIANNGAKDITATADYIEQYVINADGSVNSSAAGWRGYFIPVKAGDVISYTGALGSQTVDENLAMMWQLDMNGSQVGILASVQSSGQILIGKSISGTATVDGIVYIRARTLIGTTLQSVVITKAQPYYLGYNYARDFVTDAEISAVDFLKKGQYFKDETAFSPKFGSSYMNIDGSITTGSTVSTWLGYKIPVKAGDVIRYTGHYGGQTVSSGVSLLAAQLTNKSVFVKALSTYRNTGTIYTGRTLDFVATQDGYIWINTRSNLAAVVIKKAVLSDFINNISDGEAFDYDLVENVVLKADGSLTKTAASAQHHAFYVPVSAGDAVTYYGQHGSSTNGESMDYVIQLDSNYAVVGVLRTFVSPGYDNYLTYSTGVATQDGYLYLRGRYSGYKIFKNHARFALSTDLTTLAKKVKSFPSTSPQMERLPVALDNTWNYNGTAFIQDALVEAGDFVYAVVTAKGQLPTIMQRNKLGGAWKTFDLSTLTGNPLASPTANDGHNVATLGVTRDGYLIVSANMHANVCRCVISTNPNDISSWSMISYTSGSQVTYPRFVKYPDGTLQVFWREGTSGNGVYYGATFNDTTKTFNAKVLLIQAAASNPYEQRVIVDDAGVLHLCWGYRSNGDSADTNFGLFYAKSTDKGATFTNALGGSSYALPLSATNSEKIVDAPAGSGYCNQNGACHDLNNRYHTVIWQYDKRGATQIMHIWFDGALWQKELVSDFNFSLSLTPATLDGLISRPLIFCTNIGRIYALYHTTQMGRQNDIRVIDVTTPGAPVDYCVAKYDVGTIELSVNTGMVKQGGDLRMLVTRGASGSERANYQLFKSESVFIMTANLPMTI